MTTATFTAIAQPTFFAAVTKTAGHISKGYVIDTAASHRQTFGYDLNNTGTQKASFYAGGAAVLYASATAIDYALLEVLFNGNSSVFWQNTTSVITGGSGSPGGNDATVLQVGKSEATTYYFTGHINEILFWAADETSNRSTIETRIKNFWSTIY